MTIWNQITVGQATVEWGSKDKTVCIDYNYYTAEEVRELIAVLQRAANEVDPPKYASGGFVMPVAAVDPELMKTARKVQ